MVGRRKQTCSFCGSSANAPGVFLIEGLGGACICSDCVQNCQMVLEAHGLFEEGTKKRGGKAKANDFGFDLDSLPKPTDIKAHLDQYVIGQEDAKRFLAVAVYNHYKRLLQQS